MLKKLIVLAPVLSIGLSGCSKGPSSGDVEDALTGMYEGCAFTKVEDVKVENRMETGERTYKVKASLKLVVPPLADIRDNWQQYESAVARSKELSAQREQVLENARAKYKPLIEAAEKERGELRRSSEQPNEYDQAWDDLSRKIRELNDQKLQEEDAALAPLGKEHGEVQKIIEKLKRAMDRQIDKAVGSCRVEGVAKQMLYGSVGESRLHFFGEGVSQGYTYEFEMMKSDAGWVVEL